MWAQLTWIMTEACSHFLRKTYESLLCKTSSNLWCFCLDKVSVFIHVWICKVNPKIVSHTWPKSVICMPHPACLIFLLFAVSCYCFLVWEVHSIQLCINQSYQQCSIWWSVAESSDYSSSAATSPGMLTNYCADILYCNSSASSGYYNSQWLTGGGLLWHGGANCEGERGWTMSSLSLILTWLTHPVSVQLIYNFSISSWQ